MRYAIYRLTAPILDRIPDISHQPKGRQISIGIVASIVVHLLLLLLAVLVGFVLPEHSLIRFMQAKPQLQEIEITVIPAVDEVTELITPEELEKRKQFLDSAGLATAAAAPAKPLFESDANMKAASQLPARGDAPLPTQDGRTDRNFPAFDDKKLKVGDVAPAPSPPVAPPPATPAKAEEAKPATPEPAAPPDPTLKPVEATAPDEIAMATRQPEAPPNPVPAPKVRMRTSAPIAMLTTPAPAVPPQSAHQAEQEKTKIDGNITNAGPNAVDAEGTPLGVYMKGVKAAIGSRWNRYVTGNGSTVIYPPGSIRVSFAVDSRGRIDTVRSVGNTSSSSYGFACEKAVRDTVLPPPRKGLFTELPDKKLEITYTFTIYGF